MTTIPSTATPLSRLWPFLAPLLLLLAVGATYSSSLSSPWLFDDAPAVLNNPSIAELFSWSALTPPADGGTTTGRPLVNLSFALNHSLSGLSPVSYHVFNILIHALAALALWGILRRVLLSWPSFPPSRLRVGTPPPSLLPLDRHDLSPRSLDLSAFLLALLWALHPLQTETVACIAQRTEGLFGLFFFLSFYSFLHVSEHGASVRLWSCVTVFASLCGMASKEVMVVLPPLLLLFDRCFLSGSFVAAWRQRKALYISLACTWTLLAYLLLRAGGSRGSSAGFGLGIHPWDYFLTQWGAIVHYIRLCFWPSPLVLDYGTGLVAGIAAVWWQGLFLTAFFFASLWALRCRPALGFLGLSFFLVLGPSSSFIPLISQTIAEHRMYVPLLFILLLVIAALLRYTPRATPFLLGLACFAAAFGTYHRLQDYRDASSIWESNIAACPKNERSYNNLGVILQERGDLTGAATRYSEAIARAPSYVSAHYNLGVLLLTQGRFIEAREALQKAISLAPLHADAQLNLGNAFLRLNQPADAATHYEASLRIASAPDAHFNLGMAYLALHRTAPALAEFRELLASGSASITTTAEAHFQLGSLQEDTKKSEAERHYVECLLLNPSHLAARRHLGMLYARSERLDQAGEQFLALTRLNPDDAEAWGNLGNVALFQNKIHEAIAFYERALKLDPSNRALRQNLQAAREAL